MTAHTGHAVAIVTGDRHATLADWGVILWHALTETVAGRRTWTICHGNQRGIDQLSEVVAREVGTGPDNVRRYDADWSQGRRAGPIRNHRMLTEAHRASCAHGFPVTVLAFHDDLWGESRGTRDCVMQAKTLGIAVVHYQSDGVLTIWRPGEPEEQHDPRLGIHPHGRRRQSSLRMG